MSTNEMCGPIFINFAWQGPISCRGGWSNGGLDVKVVDLHFKNAAFEIKVYIPHTISSIALQKIPFTCYLYKETVLQVSGTCKYLADEFQPSLLQTTVEGIHNLTINAGIFEKAPNQPFSVTDPLSTTTPQKRLHRSNKTVNIEIPENLKVGETYTLIVTSNEDFSFKACLIKDEKSS